METEKKDVKKDVSSQENIASSSFIAGSDWDITFWDFNIDLSENTISISIRDSSKKIVYEDKNSPKDNDIEEWTTTFYIKKETTSSFVEWEYNIVLSAVDEDLIKVISLPKKIYVYNLENSDAQNSQV